MLIADHSSARNFLDFVATRLSVSAVAASHRTKSVLARLLDAIDQQNIDRASL
jgi:hypothetical protein